MLTSMQIPWPYADVAGSVRHGISEHHNCEAWSTILVCWGNVRIGIGERGGHAMTTGRPTLQEKQGGLSRHNVRNWYCASAMTTEWRTNIDAVLEATNKQPEVGWERKRVACPAE